MGAATKKVSRFLESKKISMVNTKLKRSAE
jgi:hypothetical protein